MVLLSHRLFVAPAMSDLPGLAVVLLLALGLMAGCRTETASEEEAASPQRGGTLVVGLTADIDGINELITRGTTTTHEVTDQLFLRLLQEQPDFADHPPTFKPRLAASYEWSEDRKILTFHLRDDVYWSDGVPVTAEDVRWTWQAQVHPEVAWLSSFMKASIRDVEVVDEKTVRFHFDRVYASQLMDANEGVILPKHAWGELPFSDWRRRSEWFLDNLVVSGPFTLESWKPQQEIVLRRNESYYESELPRLDRVVFRIVPDPASRLTQVLADTVDFVEGLSPTDAPRIRAAPHLELISYWHRQYTALVWNTARPLFADPEVRRALTLAIDRQGIVEAIWGEYARVGLTPIPAAVWAHNRSLEPWPYDPQEARRILAAKGWEDRNGDGILDRDGLPFSFELLTHQGNQQRIDTAVMIQEQLKRIGVAARPRLLEYNTLNAQVNQRAFDVFIVGWGIDTSLDLSYAFHSRSIEEAYNFGGYSNPEVDRLIDQARGVRDFSELQPHLDRIQEILHQEQPYTFLWEPQRLAAVNRKVRDARPNPLRTFHNLREWWLTLSP